MATQKIIVLDPTVPGVLYTFDGVDHGEFEYPGFTHRLIRPKIKITGTNQNATLRPLTHAWSPNSKMRSAMDQVLQNLLDKYDVIIIGGKDFVWQHYQAQRESNAKIDAITEYILRFLTLKIATSKAFHSVVNKQIYTVDGQYTTLLCSRCGTYNVPRVGQLYECRNCCLQCQQKTNSTRGMLIMALFENRLNPNNYKPAVHHPLLEEVYQNMLFSGRGVVVNKDSFSLFVHKMCI